MFDIIIDGATIITMDDRDRILDRGCIGIRDGRITYVGQEAPELSAADGAEYIAGEHLVAIPGLVNCHTHVGMTLMRGYADDMLLEPWLEEKIWPTERHLVPEDVYWGTLLGCVEMIKSGTTAYCDMYHYYEEGVRAIADSGIRAVPSGVLLGFLPDAEERLEQAIAFCRQYQNGCNGRITCMLGPHALYTCDADQFGRFVAAAAELGVGIHTHVAETEAEVAMVTERYGKPPVKALEAMGVLEHRVVGAHCVYVDDDDLTIMAETGMGVAHCPTANLKLASGIAPVTRMLERGITVGIATDGPSSNNNLDMVDEMRMAALLHKVATKDPTAADAYQVLSMATRGSAAVLGLDDRVGRIAEGMRADVVLFDFDQPHLTPRHNVVSHLVYSASGADADTVIIDGQVILRRREFVALDEERVLRECQARADRLTTAANGP